MPTLKRYADSSSESGFYVLANVGSSHPITLQVTSVGEKILQKAGYRDEDNVPNKVVWAMFDVGILYTSGSIENIPETPRATEEFFSKINLGNILTAAERRKLLEQLRAYTGPDQSQIDSLKQKLENSGAEQQETDDRPSGTNRSSPPSNIDLNPENLSHSDPKTRKSAVKSFARTASDAPASVAPHLDKVAPRLGDSGRTPAKYAFETFEEIGQHEPTDVLEYYDLIASYLDSDNETARKYSTRFFARLAPYAPSIVSEYLDQIEPRLDDSGKRPARYAFEAFEEVGVDPS
jgi:hypothetical protein